MWVSRSTTDASTTRSAPATTIPSHSGGLLVPSTADSTQGRGGRDLTLSREIDCQRRAAAQGNDPNLGIATLNQATTAPSLQAPSGELTCVRSATYDPI